MGRIPVFQEFGPEKTQRGVQEIRKLGSLKGQLVSLSKSPRRNLEISQSVY